MPHRLLVGPFGSRKSAEDARRELEARGLGAEAAHPARDHHAPDDPTILRRGGMRDLIENMLRGFLVDTRAGSSSDDADDERWFVVAHGVPPGRQEEVRDILGREGRVRVIDRAVEGMPTPVDIEVAVFGPNLASTPGAPTGWRQARESELPADLGDSGRDAEDPSGTRR